MVRAQAIFSKEHLLSDMLLEEVNRALSSSEARLDSASPGFASPAVD
jgi:hypothetical protein